MSKKNILNIKIDSKEPEEPSAQTATSADELKNIYAMSKALNPYIYELKKKDAELAKKLAALKTLSA